MSYFNCSKKNIYAWNRQATRDRQTAGFLENFQVVYFSTGSRINCMHGRCLQPIFQETCLETKAMPDDQQHPIGM